MFNNPISYSDPTGLAPEKEKGGGNRLMGIFDFSIIKIINQIFRKYCF
jgi:hypothetical protein